MNTFKTFLMDDSGASAAEYALILAVVGVAIGAAALALGTNVGASITHASNNVQKCGEAANGDGTTAPGVGGTTYTDVTAC